MLCKKCQKPCIPIGATLRGVQLVSCNNCGAVYAPDLPGVSLTRGRAAAAHQAHILKVAGSSPAPATKKRTTKKPSKVQKHKKVVVKKTKAEVTLKKGNHGKTSQKHRRIL